MVGFKKYPFEYNNYTIIDDLVSGYNKEDIGSSWRHIRQHENKVKSGFGFKLAKSCNFFHHRLDGNGKKNDSEN